VLLEHEVGGTNDVVDRNPQSMFRRHEPIRELDEESGSLSSVGIAFVLRHDVVPYQD
jgi:hypothetical protein